MSKDPKDASIDGVDADPQDSNFVASFRDNAHRKVTADAHASITNAGPIMSSAVASHGGRLSTPPTEDSIVTGPGGQTMKVSTAVRMGFVVQNADGSFADATAENTPTPQDGGQDDKSGPRANEPDASNSLQVEPELAEAVVDLSEGLTSIGANPLSVVAEVLADPQGEKGLPASVLNLARDRGMDEGAVAEHLDEIKVGLAESVDQFVLENTSIPEDELRPFIEHAMANHTEAEFSRAITSLLFTSDPGALLQFAAEYQRRSR